MLPATHVLVILCCLYMMSVEKYFLKDTSLYDCCAIHCFPHFFLQLSCIASSEDGGHLVPVILK